MGRQTQTVQVTLRLNMEAAVGDILFTSCCLLIDLNVRHTIGWSFNFSSDRQTHFEHGTFAEF